MSNWQRLTLTLGSLALAACGTTPQQEVVARAESLPPVLVPVPVRCVSLTEIDPPPVTHFKAGLTPEQKELAMRADLDDEEQWRIRAEALLRACATEAQPELKP